jgi:hypothetical protein
VLQTCEWDGTRWMKRPMYQPIPVARDFAKMVYDRARRVTVMFGGQTLNDAPIAETWTWSNGQWTPRNVPGPSARFRHSMVYDTAREVTVMFGGSPLDDTWEWNGSAWTERVVAGAKPHIAHAMAFDQQRHVTVLYGGATQQSTETWEWDGVAWSQQSAAGPSVGSLANSASMTFDVARQRLVMYVGRTSQLAARTFEWDPVARVWTLLQFDGFHPNLESGMSMIYDTVRNDVLMLECDGMWRFRVGTPRPTVTSQPADSVVCRGGEHALSITAKGDARLSYRWRRDGVAVSDVPGRLSGAFTNTLHISSIVGSDAGNYDCVVVNSCGSQASESAAITLCLADINCDHVVNSQDFFNFLEAFFATPAGTVADVNGDEVVNSQDFFDFLHVLFAGC